MAMNREIQLMGDDDRLFSPYVQARRTCYRRFRDEAAEMQKNEKEELLVAEGVLASRTDADKMSDDELLALVVERVMTKERGGACHREVFFDLCESFGPNNSAADCQLKGSRSGLETRRLQRWVYLTPYLLDGKEELYVGHDQNENKQYYATRPLDVVDGRGERSVVSYLLSDKWKPRAAGKLTPKQRKNMLLFMSMFKDHYGKKYIVQWADGTFRSPSVGIKDATPFAHIVPNPLPSDRDAIRRAVAAAATTSSSVA
jgi:hypothetical protein